MGSYLYTETKEAEIIINGSKLTSDQSKVIRLALEHFRIECQLFNLEVTDDLFINHLKRLDEIKPYF